MKLFLHLLLAGMDAFLQMLVEFKNWVTNFDTSQLRRTKAPKVNSSTSVLSSFVEDVRNWTPYRARGLTM